MILLNRTIELEGYIPGFDMLRLLAAFAVVWIHGSYSNPVLAELSVFCAFAVPSFFLLAGFLIAGTVARRPALTWSAFVQGRAKRLLPAYLAWSVFYLLLRAAKRWTEGDHSLLAVDWLQFLFLGGYTYHLWFVPTLFYFSLILGVLLISSNPSRILSTIILLLVLSFGSIWSFYLLAPHVEATPGFPNYLTRYALRNIGFFFFGAAVFLVLKYFHGKRYSKIVHVGLFITPLLLALLVDHATGWTVVESVVLFALFLYIPLNLPWWLSRMSGVSFGIYLAHSFFLESMRFGFSGIHVPMAAFQNLLLIVGAFMLSAFFAVWAARYRQLAWLVK